jgi:hypothetical protein
MAWQSSLNAALTALRKEEQRIARELQTLRGQIAALSGAGGKRSTRKAPGIRKMSAKGRAAISRAAKKRWAAWRKAKGKAG